MIVGWARKQRFHAETIRDVRRVADPLLTRGFRENIESSLRTMTIHNRPCHAILDSQLGWFYKRGQSAVNSLKHWYSKQNDHGTIHFYDIIKSEVWLFVCRDRSSKIKYLLTFNVKLRFLTTCFEICVTTNAKCWCFVADSFTNDDGATSGRWRPTRSRMRIIFVKPW